MGPWGAKLKPRSSSIGEIDTYTSKIDSQINVVQVFLRLVGWLAVWLGLWGSLGDLWGLWGSLGGLLKGSRASEGLQSQLLVMVFSLIFGRFPVPKLFIHTHRCSGPANIKVSEKDFRLGSPEGWPALL